MVLETRIGKYLNSGGAVLPKDFRMYTSSGPRKDYCLFCDEPHGGHSIFVYPNGKLDGNWNSGTFACTECAADMYDMEHSLSGNLENIMRVDERSVRLNLYISKGKFVPEVDLHYKHLSGFNYPPSKKCYFCANETTYRTLHVPVDHHGKFSGGQVLACASCINKIEEKLGLPYYACHDQKEVNCCKCNEPYFITQHEATARFYAGTSGSHMCPQCTYTALVEGDLTFLIDELAGEDNERFCVKHCSYCKEEVLLDLTIDHRVLHSMHLDKHKKVICSACLHGGKHSPIHVAYHNGYTLRCYQTSKQAYTFILTHTRSETPVRQYIRKGDLLEIGVEILFDLYGKEEKKPDLFSERQDGGL